MLFSRGGVEKTAGEKGFGCCPNKKGWGGVGGRKQLGLKNGAKSFLSQRSANNKKESFNHFFHQNADPAAKSTPSIGVIGMLAKPAKGELPPLPKGETPIPEDTGGGAVAAAAAASTALFKTTPWSGDPEEVHFTGARSRCCC